MADCATRWRRAGGRLAFGALLLATAAFGCRRGPAPPRAAKKSVPVATAPAKDDAAANAQAALDPHLDQPFDKATRPDPPSTAPRPPDLTVTNKSVGKLYTDVVRLWKEVPFRTADGKRLEYSATLETELGPIELALLSEVAPNHVRNFVALARAGYYDGLSFDRSRHEVGTVVPYKDPVVIDLIEGGGPLGADDTEDHDSIGYWLKPEIDPKVVHEAGSVGAVRGEELDSAACKFYIVLTQPPPSLDGNYTVFAKVTSGLDVARKIHQRPVIELEEETGYSRPEKPVVIRKVTVHTKEANTPRDSGETK